jgi:peptidoglycan LD-endopeptidase LytH
VAGTLLETGVLTGGQSLARAVDVPRALVAVACVVAGCALLRREIPSNEALRARQLMVPVAGVSPGEVPDTFPSPRAGGGIHGAVDILAPRGTPVLSADAGRVLRLHRNRKGGLTIYATDETERFIYYYAHLDRYRDGIGKGTRLARGQVIGYVGTTGDADSREPHLHFQIMVRQPGGGWWNGEPVDPRPFFVSTGRAR